MLSIFSRGFRRSNFRAQSLLNAAAPAIEMLEGRVFLSVSLGTLAGPERTVGNHFRFDNVSTTGTPTVTGSSSEEIKPLTTDPDNNLSALEVDVTVFDGSGTATASGESFITPSGDLGSYGSTLTNLSNGTMLKTTDSPFQFELPTSLTQQVPFGSDKTYTETTVTTVAGVARTPNVETVQISGVLVSETAAPLTTPLGTVFPATYEVDITETDTAMGGTADTPFVTREWFAPNKGLVMSEDADPSSTTETELASFDGNGQGDANKLAFAGQIAASTTTATLAPIVVDVEDSSGNILSGDNSNVTLAVATPSGVTLGGTTTVAAVGGVATFSDITIATAGAHYTLTATDAALTGATSNDFAVTVAGGGGGGGGGGVVGTGLTPAILSDTVPTAVVGGAKLHGQLKTTLTNSTGADEKGFTVQVFASTDTTLDTSVDTAVGNPIVKPTTVKNGKSVPLSIPITSLPGSLPDGSYFLIVQTTDSANNTETVASSTPVTIAAPFVTLSQVITSTLPAAVVTQTKPKGNVVLTITNNGNSSSKGMAAINITVSTVPGVLGASIATLNKNINIMPGKSTKVTVPIKDVLPAVAAGDYFLVAQVTDPSFGSNSIGSSAGTTNIAPGFITLAATLGPVVKLQSGDTLTLTNTGNIEDDGTFVATIGFSFDPQGMSPIGGSGSAGKTYHIKPGKSVKVHSTDWTKIASGLEPGVPYYLTVTVTDSTGHSAFAVSTTSFTL